MIPSLTRAGLPDVNRHLLPLLHKDVGALRLGGVLPVLLRYVEGHGDLSLTCRLLRGLHAAGHRRRHGHAGLCELTGVDRQSADRRVERRLATFATRAIAQVEAAESEGKAAATFALLSS